MSSSGFALERRQILRERIASRRPHVSRALAATLALVSFAGAAAFVAIGASQGSYLLDTAGAPAPAWAYGPLRGLSGVIGGLGPDGWSAGLFAMLAAYLAVLATAGRVTPRRAWAAIAAVNVLFLLCPTLVSTDVFGYASYGRLGILHGLNPYLSTPFSVPRDALLPLVYWKHATTPYGPLFTLASYPLALLSPAAAVWGLKLAAALAALGLTFVVSRAASFRGMDPVRAALLVGLNPVLLVYALSGAHNDLEATLLVAAGIWLMLARRERFGAGALVAAAGVKATAGLALPFLLIGAKRPRAAIAGAVLSGAALVCGTLVIFGPHVLDQLVRISSERNYDIANSGPDHLGRLLGSGISSSVRALSAAGTLLAVSILLLCARRGADWIAAAGWATLALMLTIASFAPWYLVWLLPLAALARGRALRGATLVGTAYILASHLPLLGGVPWLAGPG